MTSIILVPGLRGATPDHWQEIYARERGGKHLRTDRAPLDLDARVADLDEAVRAADSPVMLVAHSAGSLVAAHWATRSEAASRIEAALLVTPPTLNGELPQKYPRLAELRNAGWLPLPSGPLPMPVTVGVSDDDPLGTRVDVEALVKAWGAEAAHLGRVGHANPESGYGRWPQIEALIDDLQREWQPVDAA